MKKIILIIFSVLFLVGVTPYAYAYDGTCSAESAILYQPDSGTVLYEKASTEEMLIASTTKIMTALVVLENASPNEMVEIIPAYTNIEGSSMYLKAGERFTVEELLYGMMLVSGNDAATALAYHVSGSIGNFAILMNEKADELGCKNTNFVNPHGLDAEDHYSCAYDLALIMAEAMRNETFAEITACESVNIGTRTLINHNKLLRNCEGCIGGKTGYTKAAGRSLVSVCERDGMKLICVTISDRDDWNDHTKMYDWGFSKYKLINISERFEVPVISGVSETVTAVCESSFILTEKECELSIEYMLPDFVYAPVSKGQIIGSAEVTIDNELTVYKITADDDVLLDSSVPLNFWEQLKWSWYYFNEHSTYVPFIPSF